MRYIWLGLENSREKEKKRKSKSLLVFTNHLFHYIGAKEESERSSTHVWNSIGFKNLSSRYETLSHL